jgi:Fe2+ transport system protein FeoA
MLFADIEIPAVIGASVPIMGIMVGIVAILAVNWRKTKVAEYRSVLVQNMVDKGFSPGEIVRVLEAADVGADPATLRARASSRA